MSSIYSRKEFLKLTSAAGAGLLLAACGVTENEKQGDSLPAKPDTNAKPEKLPAKNSAGLIRKGDPRYDALRAGFNRRIDLSPAVIALCTSTQDVADAIRYARENKLAVAVKSGGHSMEGFSCNDGGMVINLSQMNSVEILPGYTVKTGPGCTLSNLYDHILPQKRIIPAGSCGTVGLGGLTMGGGYGFFSRSYGLTCDNLLEATMVDGNGDVHSTKDDAELLWALRGGGAGNFGVVTEMIFRSHAAPPTFTAYHFRIHNIDAGRAKTVLEKWFGLALQLPVSCFSAFVLNGKTLMILVTDYEKPSGDLQAVLDGLKAVTDEATPGVSEELSHALKNYYGSLVPVYFRNSSAGLYRDFDAIGGCIRDVLDIVVQGRGLIYQVNTLGGNIADADLEKVSCFAHRDKNFVSELQTYWDHPSQEAALNEKFAHIQEIFSDYGVQAQYINYCYRDFGGWRSAYYGENYPRLQTVKKKYDPGNFIRHPQSIEP